MKFLSASLARDSSVVERFFREAQAAAALRHPGIIEVIDCAKAADGTPFMVMELLDGEDLETILLREEVLETGRAVRIVMQVADSLYSAHEKGIMHRDKAG